MDMSFVCDDGPPGRMLHRNNANTCNVEETTNKHIVNEIQLIDSGIYTITVTAQL